MKKGFKYFSTVIIVFLIFGVPILINEAYKMPYGYKTIWGAADILSFYAVILSGIITIFALIVTIRQNNEICDRQLISYKIQSKVPFYIVDTVTDKMGTSFKPEGDKSWSKSFATNRTGDVRDDSVISITLTNIGDGIMFEPLYQSLGNAIVNPINSNSKYLIINYDIQVSIHKHWSQRNTNKDTHFNDTIVLEYKNIYGVKFTQSLNLEFTLKYPTNCAIVKVYDTGFINIIQ